MCCSRKRQHFKDYPCDTFTFAKQDDYELPSARSAVTFPSDVFVTGTGPALAFVSGPVGYPDNNTLPVRWESPGVSASTLGLRWLYDPTRNYLGQEKSRNWASRVKGETAADDLQRRLRTRNSSVVVDVHPSTMSDQCRHHQIDGNTQVVCEGAELPPRLAADDGNVAENVDLTDEFCLSVVDAAFRNISYVP